MISAFLLLQTFFSLSGIEVGKMEMQERKLQMEGGVLIKQRAGTFQADSGNADLDERFFPLNLDFQGHVTYTMDQGAVLNSPFLSVDCKKMEAYCHGTDSSKVEYINEKEGLRLLCQRMELHFREEKPNLWKILAEEALEVTLRNGEKLYGSQAVLERDANGNAQVALIGKTRIQTPAHEEIIAEGAHIDLTKQSARLEGTTMVKLPGEMARVLTAHGPVLIEGEKIVIESPKVDGQVSEELQVSLKDDKGEVFADRAELHYSRSSGKLVLQTLDLSGNVRVIYNTQVALADKGVFNFPNKELSLKALSRNSVLLYDRLNRMQAGAREMIVRLDPATGEPSVRGVGVMRLTLKEDELRELKNRFSSYGL
jgi:lipopolysaccharide export system protein LptA